LALCTFIRQAARDWKIPVDEYATGTITAAVRLRGFPAKERKAALRAGVAAVYGEDYRDASQDVVDAVAVGHCHLVKMREKELLT
jgi:Holliday junction resolvasome RuvABC endonuclease subunit